MVDTLLIGRKIADMDVYLGQIREYSGISVAAYKNDWKVQRIVERTLQILIELCLDIANHLISDKKEHENINRLCRHLCCVEGI